jgi:L-aminopeptidase/D-esterase-like protein
MLVFGLAVQADTAQRKPRARALGIPFEGTPGPLDAITDVQGVEVGFTTLISGEGKREPGKGPVRTGVTAIFPRGKESRDSAFAGCFVLNGNGEMTGTAWVEESGFLDGPILLTNTHSVGVVRDATIEWQFQHQRWPLTNAFGSVFFSLPVVAETADAALNDMNGFHVKKEHVFQALDTAAAGPVAEGNVGGGTGMICHGWKGGTGTASRRLDMAAGGYTVGVLVQANHGSARRLTIAGIPVGAELIPEPQQKPPTPPGSGSIIVLVATDAPLLPTQLKRLAKRAALGIGRLGGLGENGSGDLLIAFSTANPGVAAAPGPSRVTMLANNQVDPLFEATEQATEEAIVNVLIAAETMTGADGIRIAALPQERLLGILRNHNRLGKP